VFFSSRNAAYYFFSQNPTLSPHTKIAALGGGTAQAIREMGYAVDFIGHHTDTEAVAQQFLAAANTTTTLSVLFPQAAQSLQNVQKSLENKIIAHNVVVYDNKITGNFILPACEIVIFTSTLNVQAYCQKYPLLRTQKLVAIGKTTGKALEKFGYDWYITPHSTDELGLADVCY
jgi:uroporphyrinogen-III synthase